MCRNHVTSQTAVVISGMPSPKDRIHSFLLKGDARAGEHDDVRAGDRDDN